MNISINKVSHCPLLSAYKNDEKTGFEYQEG